MRTLLSSSTVRFGVLAAMCLLCAACAFRQEQQRPWIPAVNASMTELRTKAEGAAVHAKGAYSADPRALADISRKYTAARASADGLVELLKSHLKLRSANGPAPAEVKGWLDQLRTNTREFENAVYPPADGQHAKPAGEPVLVAVFVAAVVKAIESAWAHYDAARERELEACLAHEETMRWKAWDAVAPDSPAGSR